ncbi:MAG: hypothetical protein WKF77_23975 [Planctomycetaceae bacterium]
MESKHSPPDPGEDGLTDEQKQAFEKLERLLAELPPGRRRAFIQHLESKIDEEASGEKIRQEEDPRSDPAGD